MQYSAAVASFDQAIALNPNDAEAYNNRGIALQALGQHDAAMQNFDRAIALMPDYADACYNRGVLLSETDRDDAAIQSYERAIALDPNHADAHYDRGNALQRLKQSRAALESYNKALALRPDIAIWYNSRGNASRDLKQYQDALESYDQAIALRPDSPGLHNNRGMALSDLGQYRAAVQSFDRAIDLEHDYADAYINRGAALCKLKQHQLALESYDRAIALAPDSVEAHNNRGIVLDQLGRYHDAIRDYDQAIALKSDSAEIYVNRGDAEGAIKRHKSALASYEIAISMRPDFDYLDGSRLHTMLLICDWTDLANRCRQLEQNILRGEKSSSPFALLAITDSLAVQRTAAETFAKDKYPASHSLPEIPHRVGRDKIRIAYFSADFHEHPVSLLTAGLFEAHDKSRFELTAFSLGPDAKDNVRSRLKAAFDRFIDARDLSDMDVALRARELGIDIAVDLGGFTQGTRTGIFSLRAAPLQVNYLGYAGTMGAEYYDYLIADRTLIPQEKTPFYSEKIAYLPNSFQANDANRPISTKQFAREDFGLPKDGFVFCCFNNSYKIAPRIFDCWMRILARVDGSALWLAQGDPDAADNLRREAHSRGVSKERLVFAQRCELLTEHLARHRLADLFLDTLPFNAHTTASDALWAELPVLTCMGETMAGRVAASLLNAIHMPELIAPSLEKYEALAIELATNRARFEGIKQKLSANRLTTTLFNTSLFANHIEAAYAKMHERYLANLPPEHLYILGNENVSRPLSRLPGG